MKFMVTFLSLLLFCFYSHAQSSNSKSKKDKNKQEIDRGATYEIETSKAKKKKTKHSVNNHFDRKVEEYEKRMVHNAKRNEKMARKMEKPQYSDPAYFGHKKKPKKRPAGKKKFCKECQMFH